MHQFLFDLSKPYSSGLLFPFLATFTQSSLYDFPLIHSGNKIIMTFKRKRHRLWTDSSSSMNFISQKIYLQQAPRFKIDSIYHKDNVNQKKKQFSNYERPDQLLTQFRKEIAQIDTRRSCKSAQSNRSSTKRRNIGQSYCYPSFYITKPELPSNDTKTSLRSIKLKLNSTNTSLSTCRMTNFQQPLTNQYLTKMPNFIQTVHPQTAKKYTHSIKSKHRFQYHRRVKTKQAQLMQQ